MVKCVEINMGNGYEYALSQKLYQLSIDKQLVVSLLYGVVAGSPGERLEDLYPMDKVADIFGKDTFYVHRLKSDAGIKLFNDVEAYSAPYCRRYALADDINSLSTYGWAEDEIAAILRISIDDVLAVRKFKALDFLLTYQDSVEAPFDLGSSNAITENTCDPQSYPSPEEEVTKWLLQAVVSDAIDSLDPPRQAVLKMRFGLDDPALTLRETAEALSLSTGRVRQLESSALVRLRHPAISNALRDFDY